VTQVFETAVQLTDKGRQYKFTVSFLEIYNEVIHVSCLVRRSASKYKQVVMAFWQVELGSKLSTL